MRPSANAIAAAAIVLLCAMGQRAEAQTLGIDPDPDTYSCDVENVGQQGYEYCNLIEEAELPDPGDICAFRVEMGITVEEVGAGEWKMTIDPQHNRIMRTNPNGGQYDDAAEFREAFEKLVYGIGCPGEPPEFETPEFCGERSWEIVGNAGISLWDPENDEWASNQEASIVQKALGSPDGYFTIDDITFSFGGDSDCATGADGDLEARQCSSVTDENRKFADAVQCDPTEFVPTIVTTRAETNVDNISWNGVVTERLCMGSSGDLCIDRAVSADRIQISNDYFDSQGGTAGTGHVSETTGLPSVPLDDLQLGKDGKHGVCGFSRTDKKNDRVELETVAGTGSSGCASGQ